MSTAQSRPDPRFRPYRAAAYGLYIAVVSVFSLAVLVSVGRSVASMTPERLPPAGVTLTYRECIDEAQKLWAELETRREHLVSQTPARKVDQEWMRFRTAWLERLRISESHCALESQDRSALKTVYRRLEHVQDLYTIHAVQYAGEVGGVVESLDSAFDKARANAAAGRLP